MALDWLQAPLAGWMRVGPLGIWADSTSWGPGLLLPPNRHQHIREWQPSLLGHSAPGKIRCCPKQGKDFHKDPCFWPVLCTQKVPATLSPLLGRSWIWISLHFPGLAAAPHLRQDRLFLAVSRFNFPAPFPGSLLAECDNARCEQSPELPFRGAKN